MRRIILPLAISFFTFSLGVSAVLLCYSTQQQRIQNSMHVAFNGHRDSTIDKIPNYNAQPPQFANLPEVKWLYISEPIKWSKDNNFRLTQEASIVVFYANGAWGIISPVIERERGGHKLWVGTSESYAAQIGKWEDKANGEIIVSIARRRCYLCLVEIGESDAARARTEPIVEIWRVLGGKLGESTIKGPSGKYRLLGLDEIRDVETFQTIIREPLFIKDDDSPIGEDY